MTRVARILLGLALGILLGVLPFVHYRYGANHRHAPAADAKEIRHATHAH